MWYSTINLSYRTTPPVLLLQHMLSVRKSVFIGIPVPAVERLDFHLDMFIKFSFDCFQVQCYHLFLFLFLFVFMTHAIWDLLLICQITFLLSPKIDENGITIILPGQNPLPSSFRNSSHPFWPGLVKHGATPSGNSSHRREARDTRVQPESFLWIFFSCSWERGTAFISL